MEYYQQSLAIKKKVGNRPGVGFTINDIGLVYDNLGQYEKALEYYEQALAIVKEVGNRREEGTIVNNIGSVYKNLGQYEKALQYYQQSLAIRKEVGDRRGEGTTLHNIAQVYRRLGQYEKALEYYQQSLGIKKEVGNRPGVGFTLNDIGLVYDNLGQYEKALQYYEQALAIVKEVGNRREEGTTLNNIGYIYKNLGQYEKALQYYQQSLAIRKEVGDRRGEGTTLHNIAQVYRSLSQYEKALEYYQQSLAMKKKVGNRPGVGFTLNDIGLVYDNLGHYEKALEYYQQALAIVKEVGNRREDGTIVNNIGSVYKNLGQYEKALQYYQQSLAIRKEVGDRRGEGTTIHNISQVHRSLGQYEKALEYYQQSLAIRKEVGDRSGEGFTLNDIGLVYDNLGQYEKALEYYQQALVIVKEVGNRREEGTTLNNIGYVYKNLGRYEKVLEYYQQSLAIKKEVGDRPGEGLTLSNIGYLLESQNQPQLAIIFFKQSVNVYESIRKDIQGLSQQQQQSYTDKVAHTYRRLAKLLLKQDRIIEAQRVLDLLKVQELDDYLRGVRGNRNTQQGVSKLPPERKIEEGLAEILTNAIKIGKELTQLRQLQKQGTLTSQQEKRIIELVKAEEKIVENFNNFLESEEVEALIAQLTPKTRKPDLVDDLEDFIALQDNLRDLQQNAVLLYPLIFEDRLELILTTPYSPPIRRTVTVSKEELKQTIINFRKSLRDKSSKIQIPAEKLYNWLIEPLEDDLKVVEAKTIIYAPDGQLRYIPLSALYDGEKWLTQRFRINNITAASLTELNSQPQPKIQVLAAAFANGYYEFEIEGEKFNFRGLPFAGVEVENLAQLISGTTKLIDQDFNYDNTIPKMDSHTVIHFATHGALVVGTPEQSFILFGDGKPVTLTDMKKWNFKNVDLIVLSACETALGDNLGTGVEILGLGYRMQKAGARASMASLWSVDDEGTQILMNGFYSLLQQGNITKAEALRQAQIAMITGDETILSQQRGIRIEPISRNLSPQVKNHLSHPYYWAPFILIGNGL